jgi:acetyl esterase
MTNGPVMNTEDFPSPTLKQLAANGVLKTELHPTSQQLLRRMARYGGLSDKISVQFARRRLQTLMPLVASKPPVASVEDRTVPGPSGPVPIRVVMPREGTQPRPALVWFPGGGFVIGDLVTAEPTARNLAIRMGAVVICVDYRKAPEHTFDDGYDDALAVVKWVFASASGLGVDDTRIGVGGDSAGGNVAAVVAQEYSATAGANPLALQILVYPHVSGDNEPARVGNATGGTLNTKEMRWFETHVAGAIDPDSSRHAPLAAKDVSKLPPAIVVTAGHDPLRDEAIVYFDRLRSEGLRAEHLHYPDDVHGFFTMDLILDNAPAAMDAVAAIASDILDLDHGGDYDRSRSVPEAALVKLRQRGRRWEVRTRYMFERMFYQQIRTQRFIIRSMGLPEGRDVVALNSKINRLEHQVRGLRRQLDRQADAQNEWSDQLD